MAKLHFQGLRLVSYPWATDLEESEALSWECNQIDIYSNGWGPADDGVTIAGPGKLLKMALQMNAKKVRDMM